MSETTDDEFLALCGFKPTDFRDTDHRARVLAMLEPRRASLERLDTIATELNLWSLGLGPKPAGVSSVTDSQKPLSQTTVTPEMWEHFQRLSEEHHERQQAEIERLRAGLVRIRDKCDWEWASRVAQETLDG